MTSLGKTIDDLILDETKWPTQADFINHVTTMSAKLLASKDINDAEKANLDRVANSSGIGRNGLVEELTGSQPGTVDAVMVYRSLMGSFDASVALGGSDQNMDGVRDDVASLITHMPLFSDGRKKAAMSYAKALRAIMVAPAFDKLTIDQAYRLQQNADVRKLCLANVIGVASGQLATDLIRAATANTPARRARLEGFERALSGSSYDAPQNAVCY